MAKNPSLFRWSEHHPVDGVSWNGAMTFCEQLTRLESSAGSIPEGLEYTLPTEAQWEYACRAGNSAPFSGAPLSDLGWYFSNAWLRTHPVGRKQSNQWGIFDMYGNVWEWCLDWRGDYESSAIADPQGAGRGSQRVLRGGSFGSPARSCRSAGRFAYPPSLQRSSLGFRPVLVLSSAANNRP